MGYKINAVGFRIGVFRSWNSMWFASPGIEYQNLWYEDFLIRQYIFALSRNMKMASGLSIIKRWLNGVIRIHMNFYNPPNYKGSGLLKKNYLGSGLKTITGSSNTAFSLSKNQFKGSGFFFIFSITSALLVARYIVFELERRIPFMEIVQDIMDWVRSTKSLSGIHISCSGRFVGEDRARTIWKKYGTMPYSTASAFIDYAEAAAVTVYGSIGVKVWLCFNYK